MGDDQPPTSCVTSLWSDSASNSDIASIDYNIKDFDQDLISFTIPSTLSLLDEDEYERRVKCNITDSDDSFTISSLSDSHDSFLLPDVEMNVRDDDDSFTTVTSLSDLSWDLFDDYSSISSLSDIDTDIDIDDGDTEDQTCSDVEVNIDNVCLSHIILDDIITHVFTNRLRDL